MNPLGDVVPEAPVISDGQRSLPLEDADAAIAGYPPSFYVRKTFALVLLGVALHVLTFIFASPLFYGWMIKVVISVLASVALFMRRRVSLASAAVAGATAGLFMGLLTAIVEVAWYRQLWTVFNLIAEPLASGLIGLVAGWLAGIVVIRLARRERR